MRSSKLASPVRLAGNQQLLNGDAESSADERAHPMKEESPVVESVSAPNRNDNEQKTATKGKKVRKLRLDVTSDFNKILSKRGIVYLSRIPPRMGPSKVKSLLSDFGPITRIYLVEEDKTLRKKRRKAGGSGFKRYTEGWVEFESKKIAKRVGETLNMTRVTCHKRSLHYDDLWNIKVSSPLRVVFVCLLNGRFVCLNSSELWSAYLES